MITILAMQIWQQSGQYVYVLAQFASILLVNVSRIFHSKRFYTEFYTEIRDYLVLLQRSRTDAKKKLLSYRSRVLENLWVDVFSSTEREKWVECVNIKD